VSTALTEGIRVEVRPQYLAEASDPEAGRWMFGYEVTLSNQSDHAVQLLSRHWVITDGENRQQEVRGPGVVGQQPVLLPGARFTYASGCPLSTPVGTMHGSYQMRRLDSGERFDARIAPFRLAVPGALH
jgi:ApaG protein